MEKKETLLFGFNDVRRNENADLCVITRRLPCSLEKINGESQINNVQSASPFFQFVWQRFMTMQKIYMHYIEL